MRRFRHWAAAGLLVTASLLASACAARDAPVDVAPSGPTAVADQPAARASDVDIMIARGCYACLWAAYFESVETNRSQSFEAAALLVLRTKELGMPVADWLAWARQDAPPDPAYATYLAIIDAIPADPLSGDRDAAMAIYDRSSPLLATVPAWRESLASGPASVPFRAYLDLSLTCAFSRNNTAAADAARESYGGIPLLEYRAAICTGESDRLNELRRQVPEFTELDLMLGRYELQGRLYARYDEALALLTSAAGSYPESVVAQTLLGEAHAGLDQWSEALQAYDTAIALAPGHRDALLGAVISLSHLSRHDEAIAMASELIDRGSWFLGQAFYWRAWNRFSLGDLAAARADTDRALTLMQNGAVHLLSGLIEWRERRLESAEQAFDTSVSIDFGQCEAAMRLGEVRIVRGRLAEAAAAFTHSRQCYDLSITTRRELIRQLEVAGGNETSPSRQKDVQLKAIAEAELQRDIAIRRVSELERTQTPVPR